MDAATIARALGGRVESGGALVPGPNHSPADRSLKIFVDPAAPGGFRVHSFAKDDPIICRDYVQEKLGLEPWKPNRNRTYTNGRHHTNGDAQPNGNSAASVSESVAHN